MVIYVAVGAYAEPTGDTWVEQSSAAGWEAREYPLLVTLAHGSLLLLTGHGASYLNDVWGSEDGGATWTQVSPAAPFPARTQSAAAALPDGSVLLVGGKGASTTYLNDVWLGTHQGSTWTQVLPSAPWSARWSHAVTVQPGATTVLLAGGKASGVYVRDVWSTSDAGETWTLVTATAAWLGRTNFGFVALPDDFVVLAGGYRDAETNDVWRSDDGGRSFVELAAPAWDARSRVGLVAAQGAMYMAGGRPNTQEVWRSTDRGSTWQLLTASAGWSARSWAGVTVALDGSIVLAGGSDGSLKSDVWRSPVVFDTVARWKSSDCSVLARGVCGAARGTTTVSVSLPPAVGVVAPPTTRSSGPDRKSSAAAVVLAPPSVVIMPQDTTPATMNVMEFDVLFSQPVTGLNASSFEVRTDAASGEVAIAKKLLGLATHYTLVVTVDPAVLGINAAVEPIVTVLEDAMTWAEANLACSPGTLMVADSGMSQALALHVTIGPQMSLGSPQYW